MQSSGMKQYSCRAAMTTEWLRKETRQASHEECSLKRNAHFLVNCSQCSTTAAWLTLFWLAASDLGTHLPHGSWQEVPDRGRQPGDAGGHKEHQQRRQQVWAENKGDADQDDGTCGVWVVAHDCTQPKCSFWRTELWKHPPPPHHHTQPPTGRIIFDHRLQNHTDKIPQNCSE